MSDATITLAPESYTSLAAFGLGILAMILLIMFLVSAYSAYLYWDEKLSSRMLYTTFAGLLLLAFSLSVYGVVSNAGRTMDENNQNLESVNSQIEEVYGVSEALHYGNIVELQRNKLTQVTLIRDEVEATVEIENTDGVLTLSTLPELTESTPYPTLKDL